GGLRRRAPRRAPGPVLAVGRPPGRRVGRPAPQHLQPARPKELTVEIRTQHVDDLTGPVAADVAVVIDVVRAFTVAPWCLARGAERLLFAPGVEAAAQVRADHHPDALLLKDGGSDPRFALPN